MTDADKEKAQALESQQIADGARIKTFIDDPAVRRLLTDLEKKYAAEFFKADSDEKRRTAWAKAHALVDFTADLRGIQDSGVVAQTYRTNREANEARTRRAPRS